MDVTLPSRCVGEEAAATVDADSERGVRGTADAPLPLLAAPSKTIGTRRSMTLMALREAAVTSMRTPGVRHRSAPCEWVWVCGGVGR